MPVVYIDYSQMSKCVIAESVVVTCMCCLVALDIMSASTQILTTLSKAIRNANYSTWRQAFLCFHEVAFYSYCEVLAKYVILNPQLSVFWLDSGKEAAMIIIPMSLYELLSLLLTIVLILITWRKKSRDTKK